MAPPDKKRQGSRVKFVLVRDAGMIEFAPVELGALQRLARELQQPF